VSQGKPIREVKAEIEKLKAEMETRSWPPKVAKRAKKEDQNQPGQNGNE